METKAKIFLADERSCDDTERFRAYNTFNSDQHYNEHKQPFGNLQALSDITLAGGETLELPVEAGSDLYLIPIVGGFTYHDTNENENAVQPGQLLCFENSAASFQITNLYEEELINFLELKVKTDRPTTSENTEIFHFDLDESKNQLVPVTEQFPFLSLGKFTGRQEATYQLRENQNSLFVLVIEGAFDVQGRLLHARDGLGLWNISEDLELEALSNDAIVLIIELNK